MPPAHLFALWEIIWARDWGKVLDQGKVSPVVDGGHFAGQGLASGQRPYIDPIFTNDPLAGKTICKIQKMLLKKYYCEICQDISPVKILGGSHSYLVMRATDDYTDYNRLVVPFSFCNRILIDFLFYSSLMWSLGSYGNELWWQWWIDDYELNLNTLVVLYCKYSHHHHHHQHHQFHHHHSVENNDRHVEAVNKSVRHLFFPHQENDRLDEQVDDDDDDDDDGVDRKPIKTRLQKENGTTNRL